MSFFPDITPLTNEIKQFNQSQQEIIALLKNIKLELTIIKELKQKK